MNYTKAQQEFVAYILADTPRCVMYVRDKVKQTTTIFDHTGVFGYVIPDSVLALNLNSTGCHELMKFPFPPCPTEEGYRITPSGVIVPGTDNKGQLLVFHTSQGAARYVNKKLFEKFGKDALFFQEKDLGVITVAESNGRDLVVIGYVCPCRAPEHTENQ